MNVYIDPRTKISYASYYIKGLYSLFGESQVSFGRRYFDDMIQTDGLNDFDHYFSFIIDEKSGQKRIVIDYRDKNTLNLNALKWSHIYGKVNYKENVILESEVKLQKQKIIPIGPNFGIKIWDNSQTFFYLMNNYFKCRRTLSVNFRTFLAGYNWQLNRQRFECYKDSLSDINYIFFISSLYNKENQDSRTNICRAAFIRACKKTVPHFEGGLLAKAQHPQYKNYEDVITGDYVKPGEYLRKVKKSAVVFNTPALWGCHGWKLGEFLAMGKAIISTQFQNDMPFPLLHGEHIHFVESETEIENAIKKVIADQAYRQKLENGARTYFNKYLAPEIVIKRLLDSCYGLSENK